VTSDVRICLYSPADLNRVIGSSIWVQAAAATLHAGERNRITIPLMTRERRTLVTALLRRLPRVELVDPRRKLRFVPETGLNAAEALDLIEDLDRRAPFDLVLVRSFAVCRLAARRPSLAGRLWSVYVLEPERDVEDPAYLAELERIVAASARVVVQSEEMRALFEGLVPGGRGKTIVLPPAIPPAGPGGRQIAPRRERLLYAGKFHPFYPLPLMVELHAALRRERPGLEFHVVGDRASRAAEMRDYLDHLDVSLSATDGVVRHGALSRDAANEVVSEGGVALSLWDYAFGSRMNDLVVSTKLLDYCAAGVPVVLNRTAAQERILGDDYPLFVRDIESDTLPLLRAVLEDADLYERAAARCAAAAEAFTYPRVYEQVAADVEGRPDAALRAFDRPKLPAARFNLGMLDPSDDDVARAYALLEALGSIAGDWRLAVGRSVDRPPEPGADPAVDRLPVPPTRLRALVTTRSVDDPWNWWRTIGIALVADPTAASAQMVRASGAVVVSLERADAQTIGALADPAVWARESAAERASALSGARSGAA
jgi:glycosyltransferase involved in cell wall biosynthesis